MNPRNSILLLRQHFTIDDFRLCLPALRQEPLVWEYLTGGGKIEKAVEMLPQDPQGWTPAALALLELDNPISIKNLRDPDWVALEPELHERASAILEFLCEKASSSTPAYLTLESAGLAALAIRELFVFHGNWSFLPEITTQITVFSRPVMACLVGMVPENEELIKTLLTIQPSTAVHAFLCIPASLDDQRQQLNKMFTDLEEGIKTEILLSLASGPGSRPELAKRLTFDRNESQAKIASSNGSWFYPAEQVESDFVSISHLYNNGRSFDAGGEHQAALDQYRLALQATQKLEGYFLSKCAEAYQETAESIAMSVKVENITASKGKDQQIFNPESEDEAAVLLQAQDYASAALQSWEQAQQLDPNQFSYIVNYADYLIDQKRVTDAETALNRLNRSEISTTAEAPFSYWAVATRLSAAQEQPDQSQMMLHNAIEQLETIEDERGDFSYSQLQVDLLAKLAKTALDLHSYKNAEKLVNHLVKIYPVDAKTLAMQAETLLAQGKEAQALASAQIAYTLEPDSKNYLLFIETLEAAGEWALALEERQSVIETTTEPKPVQYHQLATCAVQAGQPEMATYACQKALDIDPQDGRALTLLGEIALSESQPDQARDYFEQAVLLSPEIDETWLNLANWYTIHNQPNHTLQTLQQAAQAAGDSIEIQLALGKAYLEDSSPSLALSPLRQASELIKSIRLNSLNWQKYQKLHIAIIYALAKTLYQLGYQDESRQAFETVCKGDPYELGVEPQIAHDYAQVLLHHGETDAAIPWLNYASEKSANPVVHVALARALLAQIKDDIGQNYLTPGDHQENIIILAQKAADLLNEALENPGPMDANEIAQAYALLAEAYQTVGQPAGPAA